MTKFVSEIVRQMEARGFSFENPPVRLHFQHHGQEGDRFFVDASFNTMVDVKHTTPEFVRRYVEMILDTDTPSKELFGKPLFVNEDNNLSGYGWCIAITDDPELGSKCYRLSEIQLELPAKRSKRGATK
jgi:hypothetical protein